MFPRVSAGLAHQSGENNPGPTCLAKEPLFRFVLGFCTLAKELHHSPSYSPSSRNISPLQLFTLS